MTDKPDMVLVPRVHTTEIKEKNKYFYVYCTCGWQDGPWAGYRNAQSDAYEHERMCKKHLIAAPPAPSLDEADKTKIPPAQAYIHNLNPPYYMHGCDCNYCQRQRMRVPNPSLDDAAKAKEPSDLVKRLRTRYGCSSPNDIIALTNEAADRIEEHDAECLALGDEIVALRKELEAALAPVTDAKVEAARRGIDQNCPFVDEVLTWKELGEIARAALEAVAKVRSAPSITYDGVSGILWDENGKVLAREPSE